MKARLCSLALMFGGLICATALVKAETPSSHMLSIGASSSGMSAVIDPKARALLVNMTKAYRALHSYEGNVEIEAGAGANVNSSSSTVSYEKPNLAVVFTKSPSGTFKTIADGKAIYVTKPDDRKEYEQMPDAADPGAIALAIRTGGASAIGLFPFAAAGTDPFILLSRNLKSLSMLDPSTVSGVPVDVVQAVETAPGRKDATMTIEIGRRDRLIRRVGFLSGDGNSIVETLTDVKVDPVLSSAIFRFVPPPGSKSIPITPTQQ